MSENEHSPTPNGGDGEARDSDNKNGPQNGGGEDYQEEAEADKQPARSRSPSRPRSDRTHSRSRSKSRSKSHRSKKRSHHRSRSNSKDRRSRSHSRSRHHRSSHSQKKRSRSRSVENRRRSSRSPSFGRPRFAGQREAPAASRCLGVFGMSMYTDEKQLRRYFSQFGEIESIQIVYDRKAKEQAVGTEIDGQRVRIDYSITNGPHAPTPGAYMGRRREDDFGGRSGGSPRRKHSRSISYSPRR